MITRIMKIKKTSEVVEAIIHQAPNGNIMATYWSKNLGNQWVTSKLSALCPVDYKTDNEAYRDLCNAKAAEVYTMYKNMFDEIEMIKSVCEDQNNEVINHSES